MVVEHLVQEGDPVEQGDRNPREADDARVPDRPGVPEDHLHHVGGGADRQRVDADRDDRRVGAQPLGQPDVEQPADRARRQREGDPHEGGGGQVDAQHAEKRAEEHDALVCDREHPGFFKDDAAHGGEQNGGGGAQHAGQNFEHGLPLLERFCV